MSELIEINAELLKWCPYGFEFEHNGEVGYSRHFTKTWLKCDMYTGPKIGAARFAKDEAITVNAKEYEKAVKDYIKNFSGDIDYVIKSNGKKPLAFFRSVTGSSSHKCMNIEADMRPWSDKYTIEVDNG